MILAATHLYIGAPTSITGKNQKPSIKKKSAKASISEVLIDKLK
jgi:hypothetical protein